MSMLCSQVVSATPTVRVQKIDASLRNVVVDKYLEKCKLLETIDCSIPSEAYTYLQKAGQCSVTSSKITTIIIIVLNKPAFIL